MATSADITPEALEALSKKATQGVWEIAAYYTGTGPDEQCHGLVEVEDFPIGIIDEEGATAESLSPNLEFIVALVNASRTGQLIPAPSVCTTCGASAKGDNVLCSNGFHAPSVDDVARAIANADLDGPDPEDYWQYLATAAISAMGGKP